MLIAQHLHPQGLAIVSVRDVSTRVAARFVEIKIDLFIDGPRPRHGVTPMLIPIVQSTIDNVFGKI